MPHSTDITLPKDQRPLFPNKCIVCHGVPDSKIKVAQNSQNPFLVFFLPFLWLFGWSRVEVPVCEKCKWRFRIQRWGRELAIWVLVIAAVWWIMPYFKGWAPLKQKIVGGALVLLAISPAVLAGMFWPRIFDTTASSDSVDYEFASAEYAEEFFALNSAETSGETLPAETDPADAGAQAWQEHKERIMEQSLGKEHDMVMHAMIPYAVGGALDLYYYPNGITGTGIATKELAESPDHGPSNRVFQTYELVMFTRLPLSLEDARKPETPFGKAHKNISAILNFIARYSAEASLNPSETCEFPGEMEGVGGKCLIFDSYALHNDELAKNFGLLLVMEIHRPEMAFAREHGASALFHRLKQAGHYPYSDMDRAPLV